jgi:hypothetical protein
MIDAQSPVQHPTCESSEVSGLPVSGAQRRAFRFRWMPEDQYYAPSTRMPRTMTREQEIAVFRARFGMFPAAGGLRHGAPDVCPLCGALGAMHRDGGTIEHLATCLRQHTGGKIFIHIPALWEDPIAMAVTLAEAAAVIGERKSTVEGTRRVNQNTGDAGATTA